MQAVWSNNQIAFSSHRWYLPFLKNTIVFNCTKCLLFACFLNWKCKFYYLIWIFVHYTKYFSISYTSFSPCTPWFMNMGSISNHLCHTWYVWSHRTVNGILLSTYLPFIVLYNHTGHFYRTIIALCLGTQMSCTAACLQYTSVSKHDERNINMSF